MIKEKVVQSALLVIKEQDHCFLAPHLMKTA